MLLTSCAAHPGACVAGAARPASGAWQPARAPCGRRQLAVVAAKKGGGGGGGKKGGGQKKGPGSLAAPPKPAQPWMQTQVIMDNLLLAESHFRKAGRPIFGEREVEIEDIAKALWDAPFAVLMHEVEEGQPDRFCYANQAALDLFECTWDEIIGKESTQSAEDDAEVQADRAAALSRAKEQGCIDDYSGWRKSFKGTRFQIGRTTLFSVEAPSGALVGQAVTIREWTYEDGSKGGEGAEEANAAAAAAAAGPPTAEALAAAEAGVVEQGAVVRSLKEEQGLANGSEEVTAAVAELLRRKEALAAMQAAAAAAAAAAGTAEAAEAAPEAS